MKSGRSKALWAVAALLAVNAVLLAAQPGLAASNLLPGSLASYLFGPKLVRAEVLVKDDGALHDYRVDRGLIRDKSPGSLTLRERDATVVTISIAPSASISIGGRASSFSALRRGMTATVIRDGDAAASEVRAAGR